MRASVASEGQCRDCILMELAVVLLKVMYGSHTTRCWRLVRHQQQPRKVSGIKTSTQQEPDRGRRAILPEMKQWSEAASDASLTQKSSCENGFGQQGKRVRTATGRAFEALGFKPMSLCAPSSTHPLFSCSFW